MNPMETSRGKFGVHGSWRKLTGLVGALSVAWIGFSAWAENPTGPLVQLAFVTENDPAPARSLPPGAVEAQRLPLPEGDDEPLADTHWWTEFVRHPLRDNVEPRPLSVEDILVRAIHCSSQVRVFSDLPLIRETSITEADSAFDWLAFLDNKWQDLNDPVGSTLTLGGGGDRFKNQQWTTQGGLRKRTREGGSLQIAQQFGWQDTNSIFFVPSPQGTARLSLGYTHPLLRGSGAVYNESLIVLAQIDTEIATDEFSRQLQSHLLEVLRSYWGLYLERANLAQKLLSLKRAADTLAKLRMRQQIDAVKSQVLRAKAEVATRRSQVTRADMGVKNAEDRIRALVNDPAFGDYDSVELLPMDAPAISQVPLSMSLALTTAAQMRPEIDQALRQIQAGCTRLNMSKNEVLPMLNLVTEAYAAGLRKTDAFTAYSDSFTTGRPGYTVGLQFEVPLGNRAALARQERRELELRQLHQQYQTALNTLQLEVKVSVREVETAFAEMHSQQSAMDASTVELDYLEKRWEHLPGEDGTASLMLDNLMEAQARVAQNEFSFLTAQVTYNLALWNVKKSTGELLQTENVSWGRACVDGLPTTIIDKHGQPVEVPLEPSPAPAPAESTPQDETPQSENSPSPEPMFDDEQPVRPTVKPTSWWRSRTHKLLRRD
jgi:outer membrane protein